jgi:hypothetical protein
LLRLIVTTWSAAAATPVASAVSAILEAAVSVSPFAAIASVSVRLLSLLLCLRTPTRVALRIIPRRLGAI